MINDRLSELGGAILEIKGDKYTLTGFMYPERLEDYKYRGINCFYSQGVYPISKIDYSILQDNAILIEVDEIGNEIWHQFIVIKSGEVKFKKGKQYLKKVYTIRKCKYTGLYNLKFTDESLLFNSFEDLQNEFYKKFNIYVQLEQQLNF